MKKWFSLGWVSLLMGCAGQPVSTATSASPLAPTMYDYSISSAQGTPLSLDELSLAITGADIILVGEWHGHPGVHLMQAQLLAQLYRQNPNIALSMEQFTRDHQSVLDQYLAGTIGEQTLIKDANAWPNYISDYRPLVEFAKQHNLDVIAANAPRSIVRCIGQNGAAYLDRLPQHERKWVAEQLTLTPDAYQTQFTTLMHHGEEAKTQHLFAAQTAWDDTMAESMVNYLAQHPGRQIIHVAGRFHVAEGLGTAARIKARNSGLDIVMVTPVTDTSRLSAQAPDYRVSVMPLPEDYVNKDNMMAAMKGLHGRNNALKCYK
ncbi:ChaN family lipoprotein [Photobacterium sp.]|uniref:ChaN family lipoprotein n=1 Tax=Photobacterium sp. TaxID=660 RepID=UPI00299E1F47|nr:ChaN family lipoprotein [Photobacterium sp.]MDX1304311.1 ChaN family lipoprotein [Photobacterium sp.]